MKTLLLLVVAVVLVTSSSPFPAGPHSDLTSLRGRLVRSQHTKTQASVKGHQSPPPPPPPAPALNLRKGEYMCGDRVCALRPGQVPAGCNGMCQYRLR